MLVVAEAVARGGPAGVADEPVMKPGAWAPFVPGELFKKLPPQFPCGASGDNGRSRSGQSGPPPSERPFQPRGRSLEAPSAARARTLHAGRALPFGAKRPTVKKTFFFFF